MRHPPQPLIQSFLVCREVFQDRQTGEYLLLGPLTNITLPIFPAAMRVSLYVRLTGAHGTYKIGLQLRDPNGGLLGEGTGPEPLHQEDPLMPCQICWRDLVFQFPQPGRYDLILLTNDEDLAHYSLDLVLQANR